MAADAGRRGKAQPRRVHALPQAIAPSGQSSACTKFWPCGKSMASTFPAGEGFDTRAALGRLLLNLLASIAAFALEVLREQAVADMDRAPPGWAPRPAACRRPGGLTPAGAAAGDERTSVSGAAWRLGVSRTTIWRLLSRSGQSTAGPSGRNVVSTAVAPGPLKALPLQVLEMQPRLPLRGGRNHGVLAAGGRPPRGCDRDAPLRGEKRQGSAGSAGLGRGRRVGGETNPWVQTRLQRTGSSRAPRGSVREGVARPAAGIRLPARRAGSAAVFVPPPQRWCGPGAGRAARTGGIRR